MTDSTARAAAMPFYYGWLVLAASAVSELLVQGATSYSAGLFVLPLQAEFHISRADAGSPVLILFLGVVLVGPFAGKVLDRYPIRLVVSLGALIFSLGLIVIATSASLGVMAAMLLVPGAIGFATLGPLTTATMASRWFYHRRGLALGLAAVATSGGGLMVPILSRTIHAHGWRLGLIYEAIAMAAIIIFVTVLILRDKPSDMGLGDHPENRGRSETVSNAEIRPPLRWQEILGSRAFWIPSLVLATVSGTSQALVTTLVPYGIGLGVAATSAALLISAFAISAATTKVAAGILADYINQRILLVAAAALMTVSWLSVSLFANYWALFLSSCTGGIALGCALPTTAGLIAAHFGSDRFGRAMGWTYALVAAFAIGATRFVGGLFDIFGGYHWAFLILSLILAALFVMTLLLTPRPKTA